MTDLMLYVCDTIKGDRVAINLNHISAIKGVGNHISIRVDGEWFEVTNSFADFISFCQKAKEI